MRANRRPKWRAALLSLATLAGAGLLVLGPANPAQADLACQTDGAYVLWVRGSGQGLWREEEQQPAAAETKAFHDHIFFALDAVGVTTHAWAELGNLDRDYNIRTEGPDKEYPATDVDWTTAFYRAPYDGSVTIGTDELVKHLNQRYGSGNCSNETVVLGGYSQGADVIGWALERNGGGGYVALSAAARSHIGFVALYGDPSFNVACNQDRWWVRAGPRCDSLPRFTPREPYVPTDFKFRVKSWCDDGDGICAWHEGMYGIGNHTSVYRGWGWIWLSAAEVAAATKYKVQTLNGSEPNLLVVRAGTAMVAKAGLGEPWVVQNTTPATDIKVSGSRIGYTDTGAQLRVKDGLYGDWVSIYGPASEYAMSNTVLIVRDGNVLHAKFGSLTSSWVYGIQATPATSVRVAGNRITYTDTNNQLWARDGLGGAWVNVYGPVTRYVASNSLIVIQLGQNIFGKVGLSDAWVQLNPSPVGNDLRISGNRITWTDTSGNKYAKDGLGGPWVNLGPADDYTASESLFIVRGGTSIHGKAGSLTSGWVWSFNATPVLYVWAVRNRISYVQTGYNDLWVKDGISGPWVNVYGQVSQYWIS